MSLALFIIYVILAHWFADFVMQNDEEAKTKSTSLYSLFSHTTKYSMIMTMALMLLSFVFTIKWVIFYFVMLISHTLIDFVTSKINSNLWKKGEVHNFFVSVGFDQVLHYAVLFITLALLYL